MRFQAKLAGLVACTLATAVAAMPQSASAQSCSDNPQQVAQTRPIELGVSGGNIHSIIKTGKERGCFSGTLGSMVQDSSDNEYILSNNHVLADQNKAKPGQLIVQPGLVDIECLQAPEDAVATFSRAVKLKFGGGTNTVDAAIAAVEPGQVAPQIMFIGDISSTVATPVPGLGVQKMGRTTCLTSGVIQGFYAKLRVNYSDTKHAKLATFTNQIVVVGTDGDFGGPGDSGSLIVTQDDCPQPVALLFAGSSNGSLTIANPLSEVLSQLGVSMVGTCTNSAAASANVSGSTGLSKEAATAAKSVRDRHEGELMNVPGADGTAIGVDGSGQPEIELYLDKLTAQATAAAPKQVEGTPVKLVETGGIVAY
jgi:hypothetical protein